MGSTELRAAAKQAQPTALRLAECLDEPLYATHKQMMEAAAELRRLHTQRDALLEALVLLVASIENNVGPTFLPLQRARAVIAKAEENT